MAFEREFFVQPEILSDRSVVHNVMMKIEDEDDEDAVEVYAAYGETDANLFCSMLTGVTASFDSCETDDERRALCIRIMKACG